MMNQSHCKSTQQYSTLQYNNTVKVQYNTSTLQYNITVKVHYSTLQYISVQYTTEHQNVLEYRRLHRAQMAVPLQMSSHTDISTTHDYPHDASTTGPRLYEG